MSCNQSIYNYKIFAKSHLEPYYCWCKTTTYIETSSTNASNLSSSFLLRIKCKESYILIVGEFMSHIRDQLVTL